MRPKDRAAIWVRTLGLAVVFGSCQDYPFERRDPIRVDGTGIEALVTTVTPTDILFVIDNSESMIDEQERLRTNLNVFFEALAASANDYRVGFVTPDLECNLKDRDCATASISCCSANPAPCDYQDVDGDGIFETNTCDGGRLRSAIDGVRFFSRPEDDDLPTWLGQVRATISDLGCQGSGFEATLEAARRAVICSLSNDEQIAAGVTCPDPTVQQRNLGFIRPEADLVVLFLTDEDDCSYYSATANVTQYERVTDGSSIPQLQAHLCSPRECYAGDGLSLSQMPCQGVSPRAAEPPPLDDAPSRFLDDLIAAKGNDITRVRAGGMFGGVAGNGSLGFSSLPCEGISLSRPSNTCGGWANGGPEYSTVTASTGGLGGSSPSLGPIPVCGGGQVALSGCQALAGNRFVNFLEDLGARRMTIGANPSVFADSICLIDQTDYVATLQNIVDTVFLDNCFDVGRQDIDPQTIEIRLNGTLLVNVAPGSGNMGWSQIASSTKICLEGGLEKSIGDTFDVFLLDAPGGP